jgi:hypothetical protein
MDDIINDFLSINFRRFLSQILVIILSIFYPRFWASFSTLYFGQFSSIYKLILKWIFSTNLSTYNFMFGFFSSGIVFSYLSFRECICLELWRDSFSVSCCWICCCLWTLGWANPQQKTKNVNRVKGTDHDIYFSFLAYMSFENVLVLELALNIYNCFLFSSIVNVNLTLINLV